MENRFKCLQNDPDSKSNGPSEGSGAEDVAKFYGWIHTLEAMIQATPGINEDQIMTWPVMRFLSRLNYLSDVWDASKHDLEIERLKNNVR